MKILKSKLIKLNEDRAYEHLINFEFAGENFEAIVRENKEITYVRKCYDSQNREIDIPLYFGKGFSSNIFTLLLDHTETVYKKGE